MNRPQQLDLFGGSTAMPPDVVAKMTRDEKVAYILENWPETRNDDQLLMLRYWQEFDGLQAALGAEAFAVFVEVFPHLTNPETIRRGRQTNQKNRSNSGHLRPSPSILEYRRARDGAGPPGPRG